MMQPNDLTVRAECFWCLRKVLCQVNPRGQFVCLDVAECWRLHDERIGKAPGGYVNNPKRKIINIRKRLDGDRERVDGTKRSARKGKGRARSSSRRAGD